MVIQLRVVIALLCSARSAALVRPVPGHARAPLQRQQGASRTVMRADEMSSPLSGVVHECRVDFGRETGTWMPPRWALYGRTEFALDLRYGDDGTVEIADGPRPLRGLALGTGARWTVDGGRWKVDTDKRSGQSTLRIVLAHRGLEVADCVLEAGDIYLSIPLFLSRPGSSAVVSSKEGLMSIIAYRFVVRKERRLVGVWFASAKDPPA